MIQQIAEKAPKERDVVRTSGEEVTIRKAPVIIRLDPIFWGIPMDELMFTKFFENYIHLNVMPWDNVHICEGTYLIRARNSIHNVFLEHDNSEWLVMLDSDVMPPPDFLDRLMASGRDIIGGWYHAKTGKMLPTVYKDSQERDGTWYWKEYETPGNGIQKVAGIGAGCLLMHRRVAEQLGESPYGKYPGGEDLVLCRLLKEKGIDLYVDWDIACAHAGVGII